MKKKILSLFVCLLSIGLGAQSFQFVKADTLVLGNANSTNKLDGFIEVKNISANTLNLKVRRIDKNYNALTDSNQFCFGPTCYDASVSVAAFPSSVAPGGVETSFVAYIYPEGDGQPISGPITYVFFDSNNPSDSLAHTVMYEVTQDFSVGEAEEEATLRVFPNPAKDRVNINYDLKGGDAGSFELISVLGKKVYSKNLERNGEFSLNLTSLSRGVYFYTFKSEGQTILTKRLIIQ